MELPKVFANKFDKSFSNVQKIYNGEVLDRSDDASLQSKINDIFNSKDFMYKRNVLITTLKGTEEKIIVGKVSNYLLTLSGEKIKINDILDIKKIC